MFKTRTSFATMRTKTQINMASQGTLPCPTHPQFNISHVCLSSQCNANVSFCSECLIESTSQQHLAKHKENIIGWSDLMSLCRRQSVAGRLGDEPQKELNQIVLQTHAQQQHFKSYMKQQESAIQSDMDGLVNRFSEMVNKLKTLWMQPFKVYLQDLQDMGAVLEKLVQEYYAEKNKDYNNDFDNFLSEVAKLQEQTEQRNKPPVVFSLRKLMQNIIPLVVKANGQFQRTLQQQQNVANFEEGQSQVTGLTLFSNFQLKQTDNSVLNELVNEYKQILQMRPVYKNQGQAQQAYNQVIEQIDKTYHYLESAEFINPTYKSQLYKNNPSNKENVKNSKGVMSSPKGTRFIDTIIKEQTAKQLSKLTKQQDVDDDELQELAMKQRLRHTSQLLIPEQISQLSHIKSIKTTHKSGINCMVQVDEDFIATGSNDRSVKIYRYRVYELFKEIQFKSDITSLSVLVRKDGTSMLIVGLFKDIVILNQGFEVFKTIDKAHTGQLSAIVALHDNNTILSCAQNDNRLMQWNINNDQSKKYFEHRDAVTCLVLLNDTHVVSGGKDRNLKVYKLCNANNQFDKLQLTLSLQDAHQTEITSLACGGQQYLLSSSSQGEMKVWDYHEGTLVKVIKNYSGWCFRIIHMYLEDQQPALQTTATLIGSPRRKEQPQDPFHKSYIATVSFDGTVKIFTGKSLLSDNATPIINQQLKSVHDCHPFGGVVIIRDAITDKVELLSTGNKNDSAIQLYSIK